ncbi:type ii citrate synthase [Lasius niger]|uniref:Citrate synthase n=1 Tax=Lasius niger TaxID=67767 RepID=A0A0J7KU03_LASNI|nr:type ii citrate synthase [Lasius niger]
MGPSGLNIGRLYPDHGVLSYDAGFSSTASCESAITFIDGNKSILLHRGYPIDQLCEHATYPEVAYLLLHGELPSSTALCAFDGALKEEAYLHEQIRNFFNGFRRSSHPMAMLCGTMGALSSFYADPSADQRHMSTPEERHLSAIKIIAKMPTLAAWIYRYRQGLPLIYPKPELTYAENFLHMLFSMPEKPWKVNPVLAKAFDKIMTLHIDHGQNVSTSTVRMTGSTGVNPFACVGAGIAALWGPAHGGANEAVLDMLEEIGTVENIPAFLAKVRDRENPTRLMGFGHRIYKNEDPRAKLMQKICHEVLDEIGIEHDPHLKLALKLEESARQDDYFVSRNLYPNIDFYSGIILRSLGIPSSLFTVFFAVSRTAGWVAQWKEMLETGSALARPRQIYTGHALRNLPEDFTKRHA